MRGNALAHYLKVRLGFAEPHTQTTSSERSVLEKYAKNASVGIEIGVYEGVNTSLIARNMKSEGRLYGIDPFFKGRAGICYSKLIALHNLKKTQTIGKVTLIEKLSSDAAADVPERIDFMFIDGDHSYEGIAKDWELFSCKIVPGGIIALHDTSVPDFDPERSKLGSVSFFAQVISKDLAFEKLETADSMNVLRRK